jgi:hypothetical protein
MSMRSQLSNNLIRENCENTEVVVFNQIDRDDVIEDKPQVKRVPEIKRSTHSPTRTVNASAK